MTPDFAVHFSVDGIALDQRVTNGWVRLGTARFEEASFAEDLVALAQSGRAAAESAGMDFATKLVLPNDQLKFLTLRDGDATHQAVSLALEGATPYALADLSFDWMSADGETRIVAVARDTQEEAEAFAVSHGLAPVAFVALPDEGWSGTEAFLGATQAAGDAAPLRDPKPYVSVSQDDAIFAEATADVAETAPEDVAQDEQADAIEALPVSFATMRASSAEESAAAPALGAADKGRASGAATPVGAATKPATPATVPRPDTLAASLRPEPTDPARKVGVAARTGGGAGEATPDAPPAQDGAAAAAVRGRPRFLGLILTVALIIALLAVAAFAHVGDNAFTRLFDRPMADAPEVPETALLTLPAAPLDIAPAPLDEAPVSITPAPLESPAPEQLASIAPSEITEEPLSEEALDAALLEAEPEVAPDGPLWEDMSETELARFYAATGIWPVAPAPLQAPRATDLDRLYVASIDSAIEIGDAVALAPYTDADKDARPASQPVPPAPELTFRYDERGLIIATPEGAVSPLGYTVIAGRPAIVPPLRTPGPDAVVNERERLATFRPRPRPDRLAENAERNLYGGRTLAELAELRPRLRPEAAKVAEEEDALAAADDAPPSEFAVAASLRPEARPRNIDRIIAEARASQPTTVAVAAPAVERAAQPTAPTRASVARAATTENAINLRRVNLIGVYGTPSNRSALVRLANGRFVRVQVGDSVDGGRVSAISDRALRYVKRGRNIVLEMPTG
ncbi:MAG: hypothetical protein AAFR53_12225 [Pseudomonadota bacterium]